jgi:DNA polymerase-3 subunit gamma/tau
MVVENLNSIGFDTFLELVNLINKKDIPNLINTTNSVLDQGISGDLFLSGLSSFFRDILVSKNKLSHKLLNYDESKINKLIDLGSALNYEFLIEYINILNESEINFQKSINQRLLVELSILKISSLELNDKKKKFKYKLIPVSTFQSQVFKSHNSKAKVQQKSKPVANIKITDFETSTLSLKSIEKNKEIIHDSLERENEYDEKKNISLKDITKFWEEYANNQENKGRYNIASILRISVPKLEKNSIIYTVPNNTNLLEINEEKNNLILFLSSKLNSKISLTVKIDKEIEKKLAYTNKDKYDLLKEKNPELENFKKALKLSI